MIWIGLKGLLRLEREILILIHQYINNGYHIVLDVNSGSVHVVDPVVYDAIAAVSEQVPEMDKPEKLSEEVTANVHKKLDETYGSEMVCEALEDIQELIDTEQLLTRDIYRDFVLDFKKRKTVVKALCLHIAHDCNLACRYCFAEEGEYHGRREINDKMRPFRNGSGSYDMIVPKFQKFAESRGQKNYYVRGTFTRNNLDFADDVIHYADLGFQQMSMEPVVADPAEDYAIREEDIPQDRCWRARPLRRSRDRRSWV